MLLPESIIRPPVDTFHPLITATEESTLINAGKFTVGLAMRCCMRQTSSSTQCTQRDIIQTWRIDCMWFAPTVCAQRDFISHTASLLHSLYLLFAEAPLPIPFCKREKRRRAPVQSFSLSTSTIHLIYMIGIIDLVTT